MLEINDYNNCNNFIQIYYCNIINAIYPTLDVYKCHIDMFETVTYSISELLTLYIRRP